MTGLGFTELPLRVNTAVNPAGRSVVVWGKPTPTGGIGFGSNYQVFAAVRSTTTGAWSAATALSPESASALNVGAVVDSISGKVSVFWVSNGVSFAASSSDAGTSWSQESIPGSAGFALLPSAPLIDIDGSGNITVILLKQRVVGSVTTPVFDAEALVKPANGAWRAPVRLTGVDGATIIGSPRLNVLSDGRAMLSIGATTFRRSSSGRWGSPQVINLSALGVIDQASADIDAGGKGYFVFRAITAGVPSVYLSTSTPSSGWSAPRHIAPFDSIGMWLQVTGSSSGRAIVSGYGTSGAVLVSATRDGGSAWAPFANFGFGYKPQAAGSENGLYALGWSTFTATGTAFSIAVGSGLGSGTAAWVVTSLGELVQLDSAALAIAGRSGSNSAKSVAGWERGAGSATLGNAIGSSTGTIGK